MNHKGTVRLETERLVLRPMCQEDAPSVYENWAKDDEVTKYLTWPSHSSVEASKGYMQFLESGYPDPKFYQWGIVLKETGELIGNISVVDLIENIDAAELGWVIGRRWWGQGIMPEAATEVVRFLFEEVGCNRICAGFDQNNPKSGRVMEKIGMTREGLHKAAGKNNQGIVDMVIYGLIKEDWESKSEG